MTEGIANLEATIERLRAATEEAREATREAHSAIKALRRAEHDLDAAIQRCREEIPRLVDEHMAGAMKDGLDAWGASTREAMARSTERVRLNVERHANLCLYGNEQGRGVSILEEIRAQLQAGRDALDDTDPRLPRL
jgi:chromosome segregation ATPase